VWCAFPGKDHVVGHQEPLKLAMPLNYNCRLAANYSPGPYSQMATGFGQAVWASTWFDVPIRAHLREPNPLMSVVLGHECLLLSSKRIFEVFLTKSWAHKCLGHFGAEVLGIASHSPLLVAVWDQGTSSACCSTAASASHQTYAEPRGTALAACCMSGMPVLVP